MSDPLVNREVIFGALVAKIRSDINGILKAESANGELRCSDDGIDVLRGSGLWRASIWRRSDVKDLLKIECRRGIGTRWQVVVIPSHSGDPMFVLRWPDPGFETTLTAAVDSLKT